ncbi:DnaJ domain-containing protein [Rhodovastum atsumiense]|uniref:DnaJ domain-containing protein n=1 Tax=Rhodovastum atsumiense TaxID=504468 RepID=A0A5M6ITT7_9PROT|nr:DnaJ domain-containing protein [Rhodovastum atsumiense]KAA5611257.1 DnaJ domain-containing protein [Rhodovastum atsumiense]CAH2603993.1 DnaJ domain-containing protein [Rhodovastum atsumiense]
MVFLLLGLIALLVFMGALGAFSRAQVASIKQLLIWVAAIGGLLLSVLLLFTRGPAGLTVLLLLGPLLWSWVGEDWLRQRRSAARGGPAGRTVGGAMSRQEAYAVLGLAPGASDAEIRAAHRRLMRAAHPDSGGSDWLASRINQARDVLLG